MGKIYTKLPAKKDGLEVTAQIDGENYQLKCMPNGRIHNNLPTLAWFHTNGEQAYQSVNGKVTFFKPSTIDSEQTTTEELQKLPDVQQSVIREFELKCERENYAHELAIKISARRQPEAVGTPVMGSIIHATKMAILAA